MSMLIQGPKQPGNNINLYLGLLQEELDTLWKTPAKTWDASKGEYFNMRAVLITTVQDYLGYGYVAGQVGHGYCGCTRFMDDTTSQQLTSRKDGLNRTTRGETVEIYSMVTLSIEDLHVSVAVPK